LRIAVLPSHAFKAPGATSAGPEINALMVIYGKVAGVSFGKDEGPCMNR
jgi:hypothetical protein